MIEKKHEDHCAICDWLGREAQRTAEQLGEDAWLSLDGEDHSALYTTDTEETDMTKHLHHVHHKHVAGEGVESWITCDGDRNSACHVYPEPDPDDPYRWEDGWTVAEQIEYGVPHDQCIHVLNAEGWSCAQLCAPDGEPVRNGPIIPSWNGDCMVWEYVEEEAPDA